MPHIHTEHGQHDHTASAFIIRTDFGEPKLMLHMHKKIGVYLQFGGHIELDETPWQAISHEILEESGYEMDQLKILQPKQRIRGLTDVTMHPQPLAHNTHNFDETHHHTDISYAFVADVPPRNKPKDGESDKFILLSRKKLLEMPEGTIFENIREQGTFVIDVALKNWEPVETTFFSS